MKCKICGDTEIKTTNAYWRDIEEWFSLCEDCYRVWHKTKASEYASYELEALQYKAYLRAQQAEKAKKDYEADQRAKKLLDELKSLNKDDYSYICPMCGDKADIRTGCCDSSDMNREMLEPVENF